MLLLLALSPSLRTPVLQVEAGTAASEDLPDLADAVARALVAGGTRVMLGGPTSEPCLHCAKITVTDMGQNHCRIDVTQDGRTTSTAIRFPNNSPLFDRARAIAIQARLLVKAEPVQDSSGKEIADRPAPRKHRPAEARIESTPPKAAIAAQTLSKESFPDPAVKIEPARDPVSIATTLSPPPPLPAETTPMARKDDRAEKDPTEERIKPAKPLTTTKPRPLPTLADAIAIKQVEPAKPQWPWIPTTLGVAAALGAGVCVAIARDRYNALSDKTRPYKQARELKNQGENWQNAAFVAAGVAAVGLTVGIVGFATRSPEKHTLAATALPIQGGGMIALAAGLP
jgi:hypothetical protein